MRVKKTQVNRPLFILAGSAAVLTFLVYLPSLQNAFVNWDDDVYVYANPFIRVINAGFFKWAFFDFHAANYHPLTWISHALDYAVWGPNPLGHHLTNNILHAVNTFLVVLLVVKLVERQLSSRLVEWSSSNNSTTQQLKISPSPFTIHDSRFTLIAAGVTGLLFGLHPLHVESVAWVAERKDLLCALFYLLSVMMYVKHAGRGNPLWLPFVGRPLGTAPTRPYFLSLLFFILALLSKPMAVTLPAVLLLLDWYPLQRTTSLKTFRASFIEKLPFIALCLAASVVTILAQRSGRAIMSTELTPLSVRLAVAAEAVFSYIGKMLLPVNLVPFYRYPEDVSLLSLKYLFFVSLAVGVSAVCLAAVKKQKVWLAAWGYYLITLLPVIGIIQVGFQSKADRYTYLPSLGPFLLTGLAAAWLYEKTPEKRRALMRPAAAATAALLLVLLSYTTIRQTGAWKNSLVLWDFVIEKKSEKSAVAYYHRGTAYYDLRLLDFAVRDYTTAITLKQDYDEAYNNRGVAYSEKGEFDRALEDYSKAISLAPNFNFYANRGDVLLSKGLLDKAGEDFRKAIELAPGYEGGHNGLGMVYYLDRQYEKAFEEFNRAVGLNPKNAGSFVNRGYVYSKKGEKDLARLDFEKACSLGNQNGCKAARK
jgi:protein O-mannosyl-transferase